uniref:Neurotransmitter-gated ion-channel ligand-binding domain-containing protein n=1 Tax=Anopheles quadriannulatus TaxID=34691 RepID=A0A2C9H873_ANOQN
MRPHLLCMFVLFGAWWVIAIEMMLYPIITHYDFRGNDKYINSSIVVIGANPLNKSFILEFFVLRTIRDAKIVLTLSVRAFDGVGKTALFTRFVDGCEFIRRPNSDRLIKAFYEEITKHSRIKRCPYYPGDSIMLNITPYSLAMPSFVPETDCFFDVKTFTNARTELIFETHWHSTMTRRENVRKVLSKAHNVKTR